MSNLFISKLCLCGVRKNYEISFKRGLNYISGPTSTGKTSILEMINYALGSKSHKSYIEIGEACTDVELYIEIAEERYRITRKLFEFTLPVKVDIWDDKAQMYKYFSTFEIDLPSNENSLSAFLVQKLGLGNIKIANQYLSFRDLFKYSYLKQTEIDTEDFMGESNWIKNNKRKNTFEIIFNVYDEILASLQASLKEKTEEKNSFKMQLDGVSQFINATDIGDICSYRTKYKELEKKIVMLKEKLLYVKTNEVKDDDATKELRDNIIRNKNDIRFLSERKADQDEYIGKLKLLLNQYVNDIEKCKMLLVGIPAINKYDFLVCPNCLKPLKKQDEIHCVICDNDMSRDVSELLQLKQKMTQLKRRYTELEKHISVEKEKSIKLDKEISSKNKILTEEISELSHLQDVYVSPYLEQIEFLNFEIGKYNRQIQEIDSNLRMLDEYERLQKLMKSKEEDLSNIKKNISRISSERNDKNKVIAKLTDIFNDYLQAFHFPNLDYGYIDEKTYLPFVRGRRYNDLGSLGGVTLIIIAYYLSIAKLTLDKEKFHHLNLLLIDSPRKNLGANATQEEFRDEEIFNYIIKTFIKLDKEDGSKIQVIVVNNGYPEFLPKENLILEFDPKKRIGLIDDAVNNKQ